MAWGENCSAWDDAVDFANMEQFDYEEIPEEHFVMTTWHERDSLEELFFFAKNAALHPIAVLDNTLLLHVCAHENEKHLLGLYGSA